MLSIASKTEDLQALSQVPLILRAELDRKTIPFRQLLGLKIDSIVSLSRPAGENVDLYAGEVYIGSGEILVNDSILTVRVADLGEGKSTAEESTSEDRASKQG